MGTPILLIGLVFVSKMLDYRDRANPAPAGRTLAIYGLPSVLGIVLLHIQLIASMTLMPAMAVIGILVLASTVAVLVVFGYVEVLRDQFPPQGLRRSDSP